MALNRMGGNAMWTTCRRTVRAAEVMHRLSGGARRIGTRPGKGGFALAIVCMLAVSSVSPAADSGTTANAIRGRTVLEERQCLACHSVAGDGAGTAADLGRRSTTSEHSPAGLAALMWSHGPAMWNQMRTRSMQIEPLSNEDADDVFAYFWSLRYFDSRGEAIRGKQVFSDKKCDTCHALTRDTQVGDGPPVSDWAGLSDPELWAQQLWNHSGAMEKVMVERGLKWPEFSEQEMVDLLLYLQNLRETRNDRRQLEFSSPQPGQTMFHTQACATCHSFDRKSSDGGSLRGSRRDFNTITGFTAAMWNHAPGNGAGVSDASGGSETLSAEQMSDLVSYVYYSGGFEEEGNPAKGRRVFLKKGCDSCHGVTSTGGRPVSDDGRFSAARMAGAVWSHGPEMYAEMQERGIEWPTMSGRDMADVIAYLNDGR